MEALLPLPTGDGAASAPPPPPEEAAPGASNVHTSNTQWIENDGLLRDDGAIFGTASGSVDHPEDDGAVAEKVRSLRAYYGQRAAEPEERIAHLEGELARLAEERARLEGEEEEAWGRLARLGLEAPPELDALAPGHGAQLLRHGLGFAFGLAGCGLLLVLLVGVMEASGLRHPLWSALGVGLLALFSVFQPLSFLFVGEEALRGHGRGVERWKLLLGEWLVPFAAAVFVAVWAHQEGELLRSLALGLFLAAVFGVSGRLLLGTATQLALSARQLPLAWRRGRRTRAEARRLRALARRHRRQLVQIEQEGAGLREQLLAARIELVKVTRQADEKEHLFRSEYALARRAALRRRGRGSYEPAP